MVGLPLLELTAKLPHHWPISQPGELRPARMVQVLGKVPATVSSQLQPWNARA